MKKSEIIIISAIIVTVILAASLLTFLSSQSPANKGSTSPTPTNSMTSTATETPKPSSTVPATAIQYSYSIVNTYPHDTNAFTEGLIYSDGYLYESTGTIRGSTGNILSPSSLRKVDLTTGNVLQQANLPPQYFGEGMTLVNNTIIQLTWQTNIGFLYDKNTFTQTGNFSYPTEGWGLTNNGSQLIMSDGTDNLYFLDPTTLQRTAQIQVHDGNQAVININELEFINGDVYANIWLTNKIAVINPISGQVKAWIDLTGLPGPTNPNPDSVLNGIAFDQQNNRLFVTGKEWPNLYQIKLIAK